MTSGVQSSEAKNETLTHTCLLKVMTSPSIKDVTLDKMLNFSVYHFSRFIKVGMTLGTFLFIELLKNISFNVKCKMNMIRVNIQEIMQHG